MSSNGKSDTNSGYFVLTEEAFATGAGPFDTAKAAADSVASPGAFVLVRKLEDVVVAQGLVTTRTPLRQRRSRGSGAAPSEE